MWCCACDNGRVRSGTRRAIKKKKKKKETLSGRLRETVFRITVDEILDQSVARLLIAELAEGATDLSEDRRENWRDEKTYWIRRENCLRILGVTRRLLVTRAVQAVTDGPGDVPPNVRFWRGLREGYVFLLGRFEIEGPRHAPKCILVSGAPKEEFLRIDRLPQVKQKLAALYAKALTGRSKNDGSAGNM